MSSVDALTASVASSSLLDVADEPRACLFSRRRATSVRSAARPGFPEAARAPPPTARSRAARAAAGHHAALAPEAQEMVFDVSGPADLKVPRADTWEALMAPPYNL